MDFDSKMMKMSNYDPRVMENSEAMDFDSKMMKMSNYDPRVMEMYNIKYKNETKLKQHINSEHKHEPPNALSKS